MRPFGRSLAQFNQPIVRRGLASALLLLAASCASVQTGSLFAGAPPAARGYTDYQDAIEALSSGAVPRVEEPKTVPGGIAFYDNLTYAEPGGVALTLDLYVPEDADAPPPLMLFIHGGGWHQGKKEDTAYYNVYFAQRGYATASAAYRLSPEHTFPAAIQDVKCAMVWLKQHGPEYSFDGNRVVLIGGSAGGHLSLLAGYSQDPALACPNAPAGSEPEVKGIVNFYGVVDCTTPRAQAAYQVNDFIGQPYNEAPERYTLASPIHHLDANDPPTLTFHGTIDELVPISQADTLHARLDELNVANYYDRVEGWHHSMDLAVRLSERFCYVIERFLERYLPVESREAEGLARQVTIRRTEYGIPHILGESEEAASFGFAWAQCEDHFPLVYKAIVRGRSEVSRRYGASDENIRLDLQTRQLRGRERVVERFQEFPPDYREIVSGFAAGTNAYMQAHPEETQPWMTPVTPQDVVAAWQVAVMRFTALRGNLIGRFEEYMATMQKDAALDSTEASLAVGSNMIALAPERTVRGNAMLLNNPHQPWSDQARYYEAHITVPGVYDFYGSTFVGGHMLTTGFSRYLGWTHTVNHPDLEEFYEVSLDPSQPDHYLFNGESMPLERETITVLTEEGTEVSREMHWSSLGPVLHMTDTKAYILRSAAYDLLGSGLQWYRMAKATTIDEFRDVLRLQQLPMFNIGYADRDGNIMYLWNGAVPKLPHASHAFTPVPANKTEDIWTEIHPIEDLMQLVNPMGGYIQNCNSPPYFTNLYAPLDRGAYPAYFPDNALNLRTQHALQLVHNERKFSLEDLVDLKYSMRMLLADRVKGDLIALLESTDLSQEEEDAVETLKTWDNSVAANSVGSVLFETWWDLYRKGDDALAVEWQAGEPVATPRGIGAPERAVAAFRDAVTETKDRWGTWSVTWGDVHRLRRGRYDLPIGGGSGNLGCFRVCEYDAGEDGKRVMDGGDGFVFAVEFGETPEAYSVLGYSQSDRLDSPHYDDQSKLFANNEMKPVPFTEASIQAQLIRAYHPGE